MTTRIDTKVVEALDHVTGLRRVRLLRTVQSGVATIKGHPAVTTTSRFLDGEGHVVLAAGDETVTLLAWEAVPARTQDVLDLGRLAMATQALAKSMARHGKGNPPSVEQVAMWLQSYQGLQDWRKEADRRLLDAEGQIQHVGTILSQFI